MSKDKRKFIVSHAMQNKRPVHSLLDEMQDGTEYASLIDLAPQNMNIRDELRRAIAEIESIRKRPLLVYAANVIKSDAGLSPEISYIDDLPFSEMVSAIPPEVEAIDILIVTPGGLAQQVSQFVSRVRPRFKDIAMIIPYMAMSAGTIWALSGNEIWMDQRAFIGPIDPQVVSKDGRLIPAQALLTLIKGIQERGQQNIANAQSPDWSDILILQNMDAKEIGNALSLSKYSIQLATEYLNNYKFRDWIKHSKGTPVTAQERLNRAEQVANMLCSHEQWKVHSHGISRDVAWQELKIKINHPEDVPELERSIRRFWALFYWLCDNSAIMKVFISQQYSLFKAKRQEPKN